MDIESRSVVSQSILAPDPFQLRDGIVDAEQINALRNRKKSKPIAQYHQHQNDVGLHGFSDFYVSNLVSNS